MLSSSEATCLELLASPDLLGPPETQIDTSWSHPETPHEHRKRPNLTEKCFKQKVVPGLFQSSQATVLELWASPELLGPPGTQLDTSLGDLDAPEAQTTTRPHRKMPESESRHPGIFQSSQATVLELWASPELLGPPGTQIDTSLGHLDAPEAQKTTRLRNLLEPPGDAPAAQKATRLDRKMPQSGSRHAGLCQSSQATVLEL